MRRQRGRSPAPRAKGPPAAEWLLRSRGVDLGVAAHDAVAFAGHVSLQTPLDDRQRELEERTIGLLNFERRLAGLYRALVDELIPGFALEGDLLDFSRCQRGPV